MSLVALLGNILIALFFLGGWILYFREAYKSRDYATDLGQLIHDYDLDESDLRRSLKWDEISKRVEKYD